MIGGPAVRLLANREAAKPPARNLAMADKPEIINPPNKLKTKVSTGGTGAVTPETLAQAEASFAEMRADYLEWVEADLGKLANALAGLKVGMTAGDAIYRDLFAVAHDVKGQGGSFGYHLMTEIGTLMCRYLKDLDRVDEESMELLALCLDAMWAVINRRLSGDGGSDGRRVMAGLTRVAEKVATPPR